MTWSYIWLCFVLVGESTVQEAQKGVLEITSVQSVSFLDHHSRQIAVHGILLGMTRIQVERLLEGSRVFVGTQDPINKNEIRVFERTADPKRDKAVLLLSWNKDESRLEEIAIFQGFRKHLNGDTKRLLTLEVLDKSSEIMRRTLGYPSREKVTADIPRLALWSTTYYYDDIGIEIIENRIDGARDVVLVLAAKPAK